MEKYMNNIEILSASNLLCEKLIAISLKSCCRAFGWKNFKTGQCRRYIWQKLAVCFAFSPPYMR